MMSPRTSEGDLPVQQVFDSNGMGYELIECLGQGGQGSVWKTQYSDRVVKILGRGGAPEALRRKLAYVRALRLGDLPVASPLELLKAPRVGYVARLLRDMIPLEHLAVPPAGGSLAEWYRSSGGLRRRLRLLAHLGEVFAELHGKGLAYCDVSPSNVFVSADPAHEEAWLIDADNLRHDGVVSVCTPGYGAPEILSGRSGATSLSDAWGFAVLVFQVLTAVHPFCGDMVVDGPPELEEEAFHWQLPWVGHRADRKNQASHGIPSEWVMGSRLLDLACRTFEDPSPMKRPGVSEWVEVLHTTADQTISCGECGSSMLASASHCPWCDSPKPGASMLPMLRWDPPRGVVQGLSPVARLAMTEQQVALTRRLTQGMSGLESRVVDGWLTPVERGLRVEITAGDAWLTRHGASPAERALRGSPCTIPRRDPGGTWLLHFGPLDRPHRVLRLGVS